MRVFDLKAAKAAGATDQQIQAYLAKRPDLTVSGMNTPQPQPGQQEGTLNRLADWLPVAGAVGGSFIPGAGTILGGAGGALAGTALKQLIKGQGDVGELAKETALGGVGGVVGKVAAPAFKAARGLVGGIPDFAAEKAAQSVLNTGRSQFEKAAEVGVHLNKAYIKHSPYLGNNFDEMLGPIGKKVTPELKGGNIAKRMKLFEGEINGVVNEAGSATKISGDEIIKALRTELKAEKMVLGNDVRVGVLENLIKEAEKGYKNGTTVAKALNKLRIANRQFGRSILEDQTGSMISSAQKLEANVLRNKLKTLFPTIGNALDNEQELIILREVLGGARAKTQAGALGVSGLDLTKPGTIIQFLLGNPQVGGRIAKTGAKKVVETGIQAGTEAIGQQAGKLPLGQISGQAAAQGGTRAVLDQPQTPEQPTEDLGFEGTPTETSPLADFEGKGKQEKIRQAFTMAMMANPKQAATLKTIYEFGFGSEKTSAAKEKINTQLATGNAIADQIEKLYKDVGPTGRIAGLGQKATALAGFNPKATSYEAIRTSLVAPLARIIATEVGVLTDRDFARADAILPKLTDTPEEARLKIKNLRDAIKQRGKAVSSTPDASPFLQDFSQIGQ